MSDPIVVDVSHWQGNIDWAKLAKAGVVAAFIKATNGAFQTDDQYRKNVQGARAAGIKVGSYHFMLSNQDPDQQAENFLATASGVQDLLPALDCEWDLRNKRDRWLNVPLKARVAMIGRFVAHVKKALGVNPIIYTATSWWRPMIGTATKYSGSKGSANFGECPLWIAAYAKNPPKALPAPWANWSLWQYSGSGKLPGIAGTVDVDKLSGELDSILMPH
jgi:lysozyme